MQIRIVPTFVLLSLAAGPAFSQSFNLHASLNASIFGQPITISTDSVTNIVSSRDPVPAGTTVNFMDGGQNGPSIGSAPIGNSGVATLTISSLTVGSHAIVACFLFQGSGTFCSNPLMQVVSKAQTSLTLASSVNPSMPGQTILLTATLSALTPSTLLPTNASITFFDGATQLGTSTTLGGGTATLLRALTAGSHSLTAQFAGDSSFNGSLSQPLTQIVTTPTTLMLASSPNPSVAGQPLVVTASISPANVTGSITFLPGNGTMVSSQIAGGVATAVVTLTVPGLFGMTAQFAGNGTFGASTSNTVTQTVHSANQISPTLTLSSSSNPTAAGQPVALTATISPSGVNGSIAFFDGTAQVGSGTIVNGQATASASFSSVGSHSLTAQFAGSGTIGAGSSPVLGELVIGTAPGAYNSGNSTPTTVFMVQGQSFTPSVAGSRGAGPPPANGAAVLLGWSFDFQVPQTAPGALYIYAAPPTIAQVNNNGQGSLGLGVNGGGGIYLFNNLVLDVNTKYFAVLSAPANIFDAPGGYSGGFDLFGQPQSAPATISEGTFETGFTAVFQPSQSLAGTTTSLSVSSAASMTGQAVTLTASVLPAAATGVMNFMDGAALLGSANLIGGSASLTVSTLTAGNHTVSAVYAGDARFAGSTSAALMESVTAAPLTGAWTVSQSHIGTFSSGQPVAFFTVTVMNTQGSGPTSGTVTVTESPAANLTGFIILSGANWNCAGLSCTRSDSLPTGAFYPPITVAVTLAADTSTSVVNMVTVAGGGLAAVTATDTATIVPAFTDIPLVDSSFLPAIDLLRESGITTGCASTPPMFCDTRTITQAEMAVFIVRSVIGSDNFTFTATPFFTDVPASNLLFKWIQKMQDLGIAQACGTNLFCPDSAVTRGQMAVLIVLARYGVAIPPNIPTTQFFTDVPLTDPTFPFVQKMAQVGITVGCSATMYCGTTAVTRGQMAVFIMRGMFNLVPTAGVIPPLLSLSQTNLVQGTTATVTVQAQFSHFAGATTIVSAGPGITVNNVNVVNATTLTAQLAVGLNATTGPRSIVATTGSEEATLPNMLIVTPHP